MSRARVLVLFTEGLRWGPYAEAETPFLDRLVWVGRSFPRYLGGADPEEHAAGILDGIYTHREHEPCGELAELAECHLAFADWHTSYSDRRALSGQEGFYYSDTVEDLFGLGGSGKLANRRLSFARLRVGGTAADVEKADQSIGRILAHAFADGWQVFFVPHYDEPCGLHPLPLILAGSLVSGRGDSTVALVDKTDLHATIWQRVAGGPPARTDGRSLVGASPPRKAAFWTDGEDVVVDMGLEHLYRAFGWAPGVGAQSEAFFEISSGELVERDVAPQGVLEQYRNALEASVRPPGPTVTIRSD